MSDKITKTKESIDFTSFKNQVLKDYKLACESREASLLGRKEVLTGKAKFGIFGDGKELAQIALSKQFKNGDFRSGYYRDQTIMLAIEELTIEQYFSGLYGHTDVEIEPQSAGRQMGGHYATRNLDDSGNWKNLMTQKNSSSDISPTAGQMPRLVGLAQASKVYRSNSNLSGLQKSKKFSDNGNEVAFGTIGDASTSEGPFWESINAAGVMQIPLVMSVWDDGYGISVPRKYQTTKGSISDALAGMQRSETKDGYEIFVTRGWDYPHLCETYEKAVKLAREEHVPVLIHVKEVNQPQGHSTSGSHERYKSTERLQWEKDFDCIEKFKAWILAFDANGNTIASLNELEKIQTDAKQKVRDAKNKSWKLYTKDIHIDLVEACALLKSLSQISPQKIFIEKEIEGLEKAYEPIRKDIISTVRKVLRMVSTENNNRELRDAASRAAYVRDLRRRDLQHHARKLHGVEHLVRARPCRGVPAGAGPQLVALAVASVPVPECTSGNLGGPRAVVGAEPECSEICDLPSEQATQVQHLVVNLADKYAPMYADDGAHVVDDGARGGGAHAAGVQVVAFGAHADGPHGVGEAARAVAPHVDRAGVRRHSNKYKLEGW